MIIRLIYTFPKFIFCLQVESVTRRIDQCCPYYYVLKENIFKTLYQPGGVSK